MKICPQCRNTYTDDNLKYCLQDGTQLTAAGAASQMPTETWGEPETVIRSDKMRIDLQGPQAPTTTPQNQVTDPNTNFQNTNLQTASPPRSKAWMLVVLGLFFILAIAGIGGVAVWLYLNQGSVVGQNNTNTVSNTNSAGNSLPNSLPNSNIANNSNINSETPPPATPTPKPTLKPAEIETAKKDAESLIYGWKSSAEDHNLETNLNNYAETVDYYKGGKINKAKLKASKEPAYKMYDSISIDISNMKVKVEPTGEKATITLDKEWDFSGIDKDSNDVVSRGKVQQQIILNKINGKWKIVSEKDIKVYYVDKGESDDY